MAGETVRSFVSSEGGDRRSRMRNFGRVLSRVNRAREEQNAFVRDPLKLAWVRLKNEPDWLARVEGEIRAEVDSVVDEALEGWTEMEAS